MGSLGSKNRFFSIFWLLLEIVLGWSEWPKNAQNGLKNTFYGSTMAPQGAQGCHLGTVSGHRTGNLVISHSFLGSERAGKGVHAPVRIPHTFKIAVGVIYAQIVRNDP